MSRRAGTMMQRASGNGGGSDFIARLLVAVPAGALAIVLIAAGNPYFAIGIGLLGLVCLHELFAMFDFARPSRLAGMLGLIAVMTAAGVGNERSVLMVFMATVPLVFLLVALQAGGGGAPAVAVTLLGITWVGLALAHAVLLRDDDHGGALIVAIALGTFIGDTGAYLGGRTFGRIKMAPAISPNKTIEGLLIGIVTCVLVVWYFGLTNDWMSGTQGAVLGITVALAAPLGDLFESYLKRDSGVKDSGRLFGAHGGALDRIDAVMFAVVAGYYVWGALAG